MLDGYKTYIVMLAMIACAVMEGVFGIDVPGVEMTGDWINNVLMALGISAVRRGMSTGA